MFLCGGVCDTEPDLPDSLSFMALSWCVIMSDTIDTCKKTHAVRQVYAVNISCGGTVHAVKYNIREDYGKGFADFFFYAPRSHAVRARRLAIKLNNNSDSGK